eukprot:COSAG01_NODE_2005_length_8668_cov_6.555257_7_plen_109_part_00
MPLGPAGGAQGVRARPQSQQGQTGKGRLTDNVRAGSAHRDGCVQRREAGAAGRPYLEATSVLPREVHVGLGAQVVRLRWFGVHAGSQGQTSSQHARAPGRAGGHIVVS